MSVLLSMRYFLCPELLDSSSKQYFTVVFKGKMPAWQHEVVVVKCFALLLEAEWLGRPCILRFEDMISCFWFCLLFILFPSPGCLPTFIHPEGFCLLFYLLLLRLPYSLSYSEFSLDPRCSCVSCPSTHFSFCRNFLAGFFSTSAVAVCFALSDCHLLWHLKLIFNNFASFW